MLHLAAKVIWGPLKTPHVHETPDDPKGDLTAREIGILIPLALAIIIIGIIPGKLMNTFYHPVNNLLVDADAAPNPYEKAIGPSAMVNSNEKNLSQDPD